MSSLFLTGSLCWVITAVLGLLFLWKSWDGMTVAGVVFKGLTAFAIVCYAIVLIVLSGNRSEAATIFVVGLSLTSLGDVLMAVLQQRTGGKTQSLTEAVEGIDKGFTGATFGIGIIAILFIISYFLQMVAFIKGLSAKVVASDYIIPFLLFFFLPPIFTTVGGQLARFRVPEVSPNVFIIGVFYIILTSALFAASAVFSFAMFQEDPNHASYILVGAIFFFLSTLFVLLRYSNPERFESNSMKSFSRVVTYFGRMMLAGCAFLF